MIKAQNKFNWLQILITFVLLLAALGLAGCGSQESAPTAETGPADSEIALAEVEATEAAAVVDEADEVTVADVTTEGTAVTEEPVDECLACHIDKEMLIATADPEEEVISENEGEG